MVELNKPQSDMPGSGNQPLSYQSQQPGDTVYESDEKSDALVNSNHFSRIKPTSESWTTRQILWVTGQGIVSAGISFGTVYGISIGVYAGNPAPTLWYFPIPIAGHFGVLCIVLTLVNWVICGILQTFDVINGIVEPLNPALLGHYVPLPGSRILWWLNTTGLVIAEHVPATGTNATWPQRTRWTLYRSTPWMVYTFILLWPLFTGFSYYIWGNDRYNSFPQPQFITATFAGVSALITVPVWAVCTLMHMGTFQRLVPSRNSHNDLVLMGQQAQATSLVEFTLDVAPVDTAEDSTGTTLENESTTKLTTEPVIEESSKANYEGSVKIMIAQGSPNLMQATSRTVPVEDSFKLHNTV